MVEFIVAKVQLFSESANEFSRKLTKGLMYRSLFPLSKPDFRPKVKEFFNFIFYFLFFFLPLQPYSSECDFFDAQILTRTGTSTETFTSKTKSAMKLRLCVDFVHSGFEAVPGLSENMAGLRIFCVHSLKSHSHLKH